MYITTSKKFTINLLDISKGFLVAALSSFLMAFQIALDSGTFENMNWKLLLMAAISGGVGYLVKNFMSKSKTIKKNTKK